MSKSVRLKTIDATTGTTKKMAISVSAGATNAHPGSICHSLAADDCGAPAERGRGIVGSVAIAVLGARQHPAALLEDGVDVGVERGERVRERRAAANRG